MYMYTYAYTLVYYTQYICKDIHTYTPYPITYYTSFYILYILIYTYHIIDTFCRQLFAIKSCIHTPTVAHIQRHIHIHILSFPVKNIIVADSTVMAETYNPTKTE